METLVELQNEISDFIEKSREINTAENNLNVARNDSNVEENELVDLANELQDLKESKSEEIDLWTMIYAELSRDGAKSSPRAWKHAKIKGPKNQKYEKVDPVHEYDLRVYGKNEQDFNLAMKVADVYDLKYKVEPTNKVHAKNYPDELLQMTIYIPPERID